MRDPDDRHLGHGRVLVQRLLDLPRVDVVPAADDQLLLPVDDEEVAVLIDPGQVPGAEPAVGDGGCGRVRLAPVALHDVVAADRDLADLALRHVGAGVIDGAHLHPGDGGADRARLALPVRVVERRDRRGLRQPVTLQDRAAERLLELAQHLDRERGPAGHAQPQR